jgi:uncharacterized protein YrrD
MLYPSVNRCVEDAGMDIAIGADVLGADGKLGTVHRVIVDARSNAVTDIVVKHGFVWGNERVVPLGHVRATDAAGVHLDLDQAGFKALNGFAPEHFHAPDPSYVGPPGFDNRSFLLLEMGAGLSGGGAGTAYTAPPMGFPGGEETSPDQMQRPVIEPGTDVLDAAGEKIGEVEEYVVDGDSGTPERLVLRKGFIFHHDTTVPVAWIGELSDKGVSLTVDRAQIDALVAGEKQRNNA